MKISHSLIVLGILVISVKSQSVNFEQRSPLLDQYDGYGEHWMFMPDGNGQPQVAILKGNDNDRRNILNDQSINYLLFTRSGPMNGTMLFINDPDSLRKSDFKSSRKTKFLTHGWKSSASGSGLTNMKAAYLENGDYNVILVDWEPLASSTFYLGPMQNTARVGTEAGQFIDYLVKETGLKTEDVHFIGHSLGAHVAGNTGSSVKSGRLGRVTGLDPALPGFHLLATTAGRLDPSDADFVDVVHSCGGILGWLQPLGDADFYPNGGVAVQPGCCCMVEITEACSHGRSYVYFTETIYPATKLQATKCDTWDRYSSGQCAENDVVLMGEHVPRSANGSYYLTTGSQAPFDQQSQGSTFLSNNNGDGCYEPGGWTVDADGLLKCGSNSV